MDKQGARPGGSNRRLEEQASPRLPVPPVQTSSLRELCCKSPPWAVLSPALPLPTPPNQAFLQRACFLCWNTLSPWQGI